MPGKASASRLRRAANVTIETALLDEAKALGVGVSRACEEGLRAEVKTARWAKWQEEHAEAIADYNAWFQENGLLLGEYRQF